MVQASNTASGSETEADDSRQDLAEKILNLLPLDGATRGNTYLQRALGVKESEYWDARDFLLDDGLVERRTGRGGSIRRAHGVLELGEATSAGADGLGGDPGPDSLGDGAASGLTPAGFPEGTSLRESVKRPDVESVRVENFKKIKSVDISLAPITCLVGGNNSGKSSVLQAIHTAVSCAQASVASDQKVIAEASLAYSPVASFELLGHGMPYENPKGGMRGAVEFAGGAAEGPMLTYRIEMYKARNHRNVGVEREGNWGGLGQFICDPNSLFSVYVPGLSGIPHREEMSGYASVLNKAAGGEANLVFRNILRLLQEKGLRADLEALLAEVLGAPVAFKIRYDAYTDRYVHTSLAVGEHPGPNDYLPVDLWGTGVLQITQLLSYVLLFRPALLLVDEPDSHLHPSMQVRLMKALEELARDYRCRVILSTHSRHIIAASPPDAKTIWLKNGEVESQDSPELVSILMDLGALDQFDNGAEILLCTEDEDPAVLRKSIGDLNLEEAITVLTFNGLSQGVTAEAVKAVSGLLVPKPRVVIHRDRDFLTDEELVAWAKPYSDRDIEVFCPEYCDTEFYCTTAEHIAAVTGMTLGEAATARQEAIGAISKSLRKKFFEKRKYAVHKHSPYGGAPDPGALWPEGSAPGDEVIYGKALLAELDARLRKAKRIGRKQSLADTASRSFTQALKSHIDGAGQFPSDKAE